MLPHSRTLTSLLILLASLVQQGYATTSTSQPWQCRPGSVDLYVLYPELVDERSTHLGEGTDGSVYLSFDSLPIAVKRFNPATTFREEIHHEYWIGHSLSHRHIAKTYSLAYVSSDTHTDAEAAWHMNLEIVDFPLIDLLDYDVWAHRPWTFEAVSCLFAQIVDAVAYMHDFGIAHRDLKVENLMVARNGDLKVIDFGSAAPSRSQLTEMKLMSRENWVGTPITMAPEVHEELFFDMERADVWSLGVVLLRLVGKQYPWEPEGVVGSLMEDAAFRRFLVEKEYERVCEAEDKRVLCKIPEVARSVVKGMLEVDAMKRLDLESVLDSQWLRETTSMLAIEDGSS